MARHKKWLHPLCLAPTLLLLLAAVGCAPPASAPDPAHVASVTLGELPADARFVEIGNIGQAYRLHTTLPANIRFPVPQDGAASLLPATVRLFHFDAERAVWTEIADSRFDVQTSELVGRNLAPGHYTAFGWSKNPVENALQRLNLDAQLGYRPEQAAFGSLDELSQAVLSAPVEERSILVRDFVQVRGITVPSRVCWVGPDTSSCPTGCADAVLTHRDWSQCPAACPLQPGCCRCETVPARLSVPESVLGPALRPCPGWPTGRPCSLCPGGLSCPTGQLSNVEQIRPNVSVLDYTVMHRLGLGSLVEDQLLRTILNTAIGQMLGRQYGDPSPQPSF
jgi:hypothetical protein